MLFHFSFSSLVLWKVNLHLSQGHWILRQLLSTTGVHLPPSIIPSTPNKKKNNLTAGCCWPATTMLHVGTVSIRGWTSLRFACCTILFLSNKEFCEMLKAWDMVLKPDPALNVSTADPSLFLLQSVNNWGITWRRWKFAVNLLWNLHSHSGSFWC